MAMGIDVEAALKALAQADDDLDISDLDDLNVNEIAVAEIAGDLAVDEMVRDLELDDVDSLNQWAESLVDPIADASDYWIAMGVYHARRETHQESVEAFRRAVLLDPTDDQAWRWMQPELEAIGLDAEAADAAMRAETIAKTHALGEKLSENPDADPGAISTLAGLLDDLNRPFEALAWRTVAITVRHSKSELSDQQAAQAITAINEERLRRLENGSIDTQDTSDNILVE